MTELTPPTSDEVMARLQKKREIAANLDMVKLGSPWAADIQDQVRAEMVAIVDQAIASYDREKGHWPDGCPGVWCCPVAQYLTASPTFYARISKVADARHQMTLEMKAANLKAVLEARAQRRREAEEFAGPVLARRRIDRKHPIYRVCCAGLPTDADGVYSDMRKQGRALEGPGWFFADEEAAYAFAAAAVGTGTCGTSRVATCWSLIGALDADISVPGGEDWTFAAHTYP